MRVEAWFAICAAFWSAPAVLQVSGDARRFLGAVADARGDAWRAAPPTSS